MGKPTIIELAEAAGVSPTTVSHAFSGRRYVEPETRDRILALASRMGYHANPRARRLRTGGASTIALASSMPFAVAAGPSKLGFLMEIAASAAMTALTRNLALCLVPPLQPGLSLGAIETDGVIVVEPLGDDPILSFFQERGTPVVSIGKAPGQAGVPYVDMQSEATARLILEHLWRPGGRIGLVTGRQRRNSYLETESAYEAFAQERGFEPLALRVDEVGGEGAAYEAALDFLGNHRDMDAVCVPVDAFATGVLSAAQSLGRAIPDELRIATRYDGMRARLATPSLTAVDLHLDRVAERAVELLIATMDQKAPPDHAMPPPSLIVRHSSSTL
jgi:DNA-binding LacI/PurR family transcriptional regulator